MAYRRPAIQVIQQFQSSAAALALPALPACVVGPSFQIATDVDAGQYLGVDADFDYVGLAVGGVVDLGTTPDQSTPEGISQANVFQRVSVTLKNAYLQILPASGSLPATGALVSTNTFQDESSGAFATIDPTATNAPVYYVDVISGSGVADADLGRKLVTAKTDANNLVVSTEWQSESLPVAAVTYRVLEFRASELLAEGKSGVTLTSEHVELSANLTTSTDATPLLVAQADVYLAWRALRTDLAGVLTAFTDLDDLEAVYGTDAIVPANIGAYAVSLALQNTTTAISYTGVDDTWFDDESLSYQNALEFLQGQDVYGIALLSQNPAVHQLGKSHVEEMSDPTAGRERACFINQELITVAVIEPPSGIGTKTSAGSGNGTSGDANVTFRDPTNGSFVADGVRPGYYLEIAAYTAAAGTQRTIAPDEADYLKTGSPNVLRIGRGTFTSGDVGKVILVRGSTTTANDKEYPITSIISTAKVGSSAAPNTPEVMLSSTRAWVSSLVRSVTHNGSDGVVAATSTWTFTNGAFTSADVGCILFMAGASHTGNNGVFTISAVTSGTTLVTNESPAADETFGSGVTEKVYSIVREPARDITSDAVDSTSREWTILNGEFTTDDIGRELVITGAVNSANNATHIIEAILSPTIARTDNTTSPVTEAFTGLSGSITITIAESGATDEENEYILTQRHEINSVDSNSQITLVSDPTNGAGITLNTVHYRVTRDLSLDEQATQLAGYATSFAERRVVSTWPDILAVSYNSAVVPVPGYFAGAVLSGMTAGLPSQQGFTNLTLTGFVGRENSDDLFTDTQLDVIAGGGNMIFTQPVINAALLVRHQLTTDMSTIEFQEFSVTRTVDLLARFFRGLLAPFLGVWNLTDSLIDMVKTRVQGGFTFLLAQKAARVGAPINSGQLESIQPSDSEPDTLEVTISAGIPLPVNNITFTMLV